MDRSNFISIKNLHYAIVTQNNSLGYACGQVKPFGVSAKINVEPETPNAQFYADGILQENTTFVPGGKVSLETGVLPLGVNADIFGHTLDGKGGLIHKSSDVSPYLALLYEREKANGKRRFICLYVVQLYEPKEDAETKGKDIKFQGEAIEGMFLPRPIDQQWKYYTDEEESNYIDVSNTFYNTVGTPDSTQPTISSTTPANNATGVATNSTFVWTFSKSLNPATINTNNFYLIKDTDSSIVGASIVYDDNAKTVTLTPAASLAPATKYIAVADADVTDLSGNHLVQLNKSFTTA